ncbi:MAG: TerC family protein [Armatimonadetes bacterium]|nr:TerC family protein [Armatimonadota bacterium]
MELLLNPSAWIGLLTLTILEIVLGIDNIVFVSILSGKLKGEERERARKQGMLLAIVPRILLLLGIGLLVRATHPLFEIPLLYDAMVKGGETIEVAKEAAEISLKDLLLIGGGLFLIYKSVKEIHHKLEGVEEDAPNAKAKAEFAKVILAILGINIIFSLDSVITAVGMVKEIEVMIAAVVVSGIFMIYYSGLVSKYVDKHPTIKILALAFLVLIGANLIADGCGVHVPKGYTYFAMAFAVIVETINIRVRKSNPVQLHEEEYVGE